MKAKTITLIALGVSLLFAALLKGVSQDAGQPSRQRPRQLQFEYASVRFMAEKTSIVWPDGSVDNVMTLNGKSRFDNGSEKYPKGADYRMYWLTVAMNIMAQRGFELVHMADADVIMRRQATTPH